MSFKVIEARRCMKEWRGGGECFLQRWLINACAPLLPPSMRTCMCECGWVYVRCVLLCAVCVMCRCVHTCVSLCVYEMVYALIF